mmetsp:Transcript_21290/g.58958  ORF Transcript_21290/g.58958 Transcript_21290/m.58958 type:complete len:327 (+) Transcript_21290:197-1177(+)
MTDLSLDAESSCEFEASYLQAQPVVIIPGKQIPKHVKESRRMESTTVPITPVVEEKTMEEKIGRWSEEEHNIFLEGLATHGKQWKTISTMIGTRTVVQVRTHAQKYFQKLERKNKAANKAVGSVSISHSKQSKRKSLPTSLPSRKKSKSVSPVKQTVPRTASLSLVSIDHYQHPPSDMSAHVSTSSLSTGNWSTESPTGVHELDLQNSSIEDSTKDEDNYLLEDAMAAAESAQAAVENADDPLDWLISGGMGHLPESSLGQNPPMFPDFSDLSSDAHVLEEQSKPITEAPAIPATKPFDASVLHEIADPKVTVQSLFLDDGDAHLL